MRRSTNFNMKLPEDEDFYNVKDFTDDFEIIDDELKNRNHRVNVEKTTKHYTGNGKEQRIFDKAPDIREHMIFLEEGKRSKEYELFMQNVYSFSVNGKNRHDDAPDSLAMAINMAFFGGNEMKILKRMF